MTRTRLWCLLALAPIMSLATPLAHAADHCRAGEVAYFACQTRAKKLISLCGAAAGKTPSALHYRFGPPGKIELEYPSAGAADSLTRFSYNEYTRAMTYYVDIGFANGGYRYALFKRYDGTESPVTDYGVSVTAPDGRDTTIECVGKTTQRLPELAPVLHCDKEHAFGCPGG